MGTDRKKNIHMPGENQVQSRVADTAFYDSVFGGGVRHVHMLGVNGISMIGLAELLLSMGFRISGSDLVTSERTDRLAQRGAMVYAGNSGDHIKTGDPPDLLVYTGAAGPDNPERVRAAELGIKCMERSELLGRLMAAHAMSVGVSGTHGKTTTASMIASILLAEGLDPTINIGGECEIPGLTSRIGGSGKFFLAEACEYLNTFLWLRPSVAVITNIEYDHSDYFKDIGQLRESFAQFAMQAGVAVVANGDDASVGLLQGLLAAGAGAARLGSRALLTECTAAGGSSAANVNWVTFGIKSQGLDFRARDISYDKDNCATFVIDSENFGQSRKIRIHAPGEYNVYNALAATAAAMTAGCSFEAAAAGLESFRGIKKRFEYKGSVNGCDIFDDYAHHPSAVRLALESARVRANGGGRLICVFQPHTYSRTKTFLTEFADAFAAADHTLLADIFPAREDDPGDINSAMLADRINKMGGRARYFPGGFSEIAEWVADNAKPGDLVLTMGAGRASQVADLLLSGTPSP